MPNKNNTSADLARLVYQKLKLVKNNKARPNLKVLNSLFETLFFTSLKTEEGQLIQVNLILINPENPDPNPPAIKTAQRWACIKFPENISFNVKNLTKLSKAADPWSSSLAVYYEPNGSLFIWGMIDQALHNQSYLNHEIKVKPDQPGLFQAMIMGIGNIQVTIDYELIANLKQNSLTSNYIDVFSRGQISDILKENFQIFKTETQVYIDNNFNKNSAKNWESVINSLVRKSLSRMLIKIQNYHHGGAILITKNTEVGLNIKHEVTYERLHHAIISFMKNYISVHNHTTKAIKLVDTDSAQIPTELYLDEFMATEDLEETRDEIKGAIRFISSLSCIDGLVILTPDLRVAGFGTVIQSHELPENIYLSDRALIKEESLIAVSPDHFGTRHRSMFSYCWDNTGSIGLVVSQDGEIRAISRIDDKLVVWENIKVHQFIKSDKLIRPIQLSANK